MDVQTEGRMKEWKNRMKKKNGTREIKEKTGWIERGKE